VELELQADTRLNGQVHIGVYDDVIDNQVRAMGFGPGGVPADGTAQQRLGPAR
jgi:hypothetical protein